MKNEVKIFKKISNLPFGKKNRLLAHCFDPYKTIISFFLFKRDVSDNIRNTARGVAINGLPTKTT